MRPRRALVGAATLGAALLLGRTALAQTDYDPSSRAWNGTSELVRIAAEVGVELVPVRDLDWARMRRAQALLVLYPRANLGLADVSSFLDEGGRVAWLDDFGASERFWRWFQFQRDPAPRGIARAPELPELLLGRPRMTHALTEEVDALVTNIPVALSHPRLSPVFELAGSGQGLVLVGQIGSGRLVAGGDPSVLLNTMMRFPGNRRFARNLLTFLAGRGGRVTLVWGDARPRGEYRGARSRAGVRGAVNTLNDALGALSAVLASPGALRPVSGLLCLAAALALAMVTWGKRPSERYGPRGPIGKTAGATERVAIFGVRGANLLFPTLVARRLLEHRLLRATGLRPPIDLRAVLQRAGDRLSNAERDEVRALLVELDALGDVADEPRVARIGARRFASLWLRISAILRRLENPR